MPRRDSTRTSGRPRKGPSERRKKWISLRVTDQERAVIEQRAQAQRLPPSIYVRRIAYRGWVRNTKVGIELIRIAADLEEQAKGLANPRTVSPAALAETLRDVVEQLRGQIPHL